MKADPLAFPLIHKLGKRIQPVLTGKYWIAIIISLCVLIYLPSIISGYFADDNWHRLEYSPDAIQKLSISDAVIRKGATELYSFSGKNPERIQALRDKGIVPWWISENIKINFFRPLSSLTLALDYNLWPDAPLISHIHSLLWFLVLVILVMQFYRVIFGNPALAGLGAFLFAIDDLHSGAAGWISNRHAAVSMVFGVLCLLLYTQGKQRKDSRRIFLAYAAFVAALLASEMGLATFGFLFAYTLILEQNDLRSGIKNLLPFVLIVIAWRLLYNLLGYGVINSMMYIDPVRSPLEFLIASLQRFPILLFSAIGLPVADAFMLASPKGVIFLSIFCSLLAAVIFMLIFAFSKRNSLAGYWGISLLCVIFPLSAGFPRNTTLGFASLAVMGLLIIFFEELGKTPASAYRTWLKKLPIRALMVFFIFIHMIFSPLYSAFLLPSSFEIGRQFQQTLVNFGNSVDIEEQHVIVVNPPGVSTIDAGLVAKLFTDEPFPAYIRYLSSGNDPVEIYRPDEKTLIVTPNSGYAPMPGAIRNPNTGQELHIHPDNLTRRTDSFYYNPRIPLQAGQQIQLTGLTIEVSEMNSDGQIAQAIFHFDKPLEDHHYLWLWWDSESLKYDPFQPPLVGETNVYQ